MLYKLAVTVALVIAVLVAAALIRGGSRLVVGRDSSDRSRFWIAQATHLLALAGIITVVVMVWFGGGAQMGMVGGWAAAGLTIALQRVVTAFAGYLIILRGNVFTVGDRIMLGGVRGDVVALGFMQTTVMEMGQSRAEQNDDPSMWIHGRQYSGRIVRVTNDKIFDEPVYNYTRDFAFMWEEIVIPVEYESDWRRVERIMLQAAETHTADIAAQARRALEKAKEKYFLTEDPGTEPQVFLRLTDNWIELSLRFMAPTHGVRALKDSMSRVILDAMQQANIGVASSTYAIVKVPPLDVRLERPVS